MNKKKLIIVVIIAAVVAAGVVFVTFRRNSAEAGIPKWLPKNLQAEIRSLDYKNPRVKLLISEVKNIHVKDPAHPPQSLIEKIEYQIKEIKYQKSNHKPYTPSKPTPEEEANLKKVPTFYTAGKPYQLATPNKTTGMDFYKSLPTDQLRWYDFTSVVVLPYAELDSGSEKADLSSVAPDMKGDPNLGIISYVIEDPKTGKEIFNTVKFPGKGAPTAVKVVGTTVYYKFKNGEMMAFNAKYPPSYKFISKIP